MRTLSIDLETYSSVDIGKAGIYPYVESDDFEILLFSYAFDDDPVEVIDLACEEKLPMRVKLAMADPNVLKAAHNAPFERRCLSKYFNTELPIEQWEDTMVRAAEFGLPFGLGAVAKALGFPEDKQKMAVGKALIRYFCVPCKPTRTNNGRTRNLPHHDAEKWRLFKVYCAQDVVVEREIRKMCPPMSDAETKLWQVDQRISDRGVMIDIDLVDAALKIDAETKKAQTAEAAEITGLDNPNSVAQLKAWFEEQLGEQIDSLSKAKVAELLTGNQSAEITRALELRREMGKTSVKKYAAMKTAACEDHRIHGLLQFYGANRTGRWAGRLVQVQNLPQNHLNDLEEARNAVLTGDAKLVRILYGNVPDTLSQLIRTAFIPKPGCRFLVADYSAIEARVLAYLANEKWRLDVFNTHGKIYEASASQMFHIPIEQIVKGSPLRQKGKVSELALGYGGGVNALIQMGALLMGLDEAELPGIVDAWRAASPSIKQFWYSVNNAALYAIDGEPTALSHNIRFHMVGANLCITLPSGRKLWYRNARIGTNRFGSDSIIYDGMNQTTKQWGPQETYGGKLTENIVQAFSRDCLAAAMVRLEEAGYPIVFHIHDEVILEVPDDFGSLEEVYALMNEPSPWNIGLPLKADGYETMFYKKD